MALIGAVEGGGAAGVIEVGLGQAAAAGSEYSGAVGGLVDVPSMPARSA